jgi:hypothetical protein
VIKKVFGPTGDELFAEVRTEHNEELYNVYSSLGFVRVVQ